MIEDLKMTALLFLFVALIAATGFVGGYYAGILHAIDDSRMSYDAGVVTMELDGHEFVHIAEM